MRREQWLMLAPRVPNDSQNVWFTDIIGRFKLLSTDSSIKAQISNSPDCLPSKISQNDKFISSATKQNGVHR